MSQPYTHEDFFRIHDAAFVAWLETLYVDYGRADNLLTTLRDNRSILTVRAAPHRAFAAVVDLLGSKNWIDEAARQKMLATPDMETLPLPFVSWSRDDPVTDPQFAMVNRRLASTTINPDTGESYVMPAPHTKTIDYTANFWALKNYTEAHIKEWLLVQFTGVTGAAPNERFIRVQHAAPYGVIKTSLKLASLSDNSVLEGTEVRYKRWDAVLTMRALFMLPAVV